MVALYESASVRAIIEFFSSIRAGPGTPCLSQNSRLFLSNNAEKMTAAGISTKATVIHSVSYFLALTTVAAVFGHEHVKFRSMAISKKRGVVGP